MKKLFKGILITAFAAVTALACAAFAACKKDGGGETDDSPKYNFTVKLDETHALNGQTGGKDGGKVTGQLCVGVENCKPLPDGFIGADGTYTISQKQVNAAFPNLSKNGDITQFSLHVFDVPAYDGDCEKTVNGAGDYTMTLTKTLNCDHTCAICGKCETSSKNVGCVALGTCERHSWTVTVKCGNELVNDAKIKIVNGNSDIEYNVENGSKQIKYIDLKANIEAAASYTVTVTSATHAGYTHAAVTLDKDTPAAIEVNLIAPAA